MASCIADAQLFVLSSYKDAIVSHVSPMHTEEYPVECAMHAHSDSGLCCSLKLADSDVALMITAFGYKVTTTTSSL